LFVNWLWGLRASCPLTAAAWFDLVLSESEAQQYTLWTAIVRGKNNTTGVGLIEVYRVQ